VNSSNKTIKKPIGLELIAVLTILVSLPFASPGVTLLRFPNALSLVDWSFLFLGIYAFALGVILLTQLSLAKFWYFGNVFWSICFAFFLLWSFDVFKALGVSWIGGYVTNYFSPLVIFTPAFAYCLLCLLYFQTRAVKEYFHVVKHEKSNREKAFISSKEQPN